MRISFCIAIACIIGFSTCTIISYAQPVLGIKATLSLATTASQEYANAYRLGFEGGVFHDFVVSKHFSFLAELLYSMKGCSGGSTFNLQYLTVPVLLDYHVNHSFDFIFGPEVGFLLKADYSFSDQPSIVVTPQLHKIDVGLKLGLRYRIAKKWGVECRVSYGLTSIRKAKYFDGMETLELDAKNNPHNIAAQAGFFYDIHL